MLALYQQAATTCPGLPLTGLAAIGNLESARDTSDLPGVHSGANSAGAEGSMQMELGTFRRARRSRAARRCGAAHLLRPYRSRLRGSPRPVCANGTTNGTDLAAVLFAYNHSEAYVSEVLDLARS
jgi:hypothetical protein